MVKLRSGKHVAYWLDRLGKTQSWLAGEVGLTNGAINHIVVGRCKPSEPTLDKILSALELSPGEFWGVDLDREKVPGNA